MLTRQERGVRQEPLHRGRAARVAAHEGADAACFGSCESLVQLYKPLVRPVQITTYVIQGNEEMLFHVIHFPVRITRVLSSIPFRFVSFVFFPFRSVPFRSVSFPFLSFPFLSFPFLYPFRF